MAIPAPIDKNKEIDNKHEIYNYITTKFKENTSPTKHHF